MKKILFFLFCLCPGFAGAQAFVTFDSTWQQKIDTNYYFLRKTIYSDGSEYTSKQFAGNDATIFGNALKTAENGGNRMANVAYDARDFDKNIRAVIQLGDSLLIQTGMDLTDTLAARYSPRLGVAGWKVYEGGGTWDVTFIISGQGALRYEVSGWPQRGATIISNTLRLNNFKDTGEALDIYRAPGGNWFSIDDKVKIKHPDNQGL